MSDALKNIGKRLSSKEVWLRALYIILYLFICYLAAFAVLFIILFQFISSIIIHDQNPYLLQFSQSLNQYYYDVLRFITYNTEEKPFPFKSWPKSN